MLHDNDHSPPRIVPRLAHDRHAVADRFDPRIRAGAERIGIEQKSNHPKETHVGIGNVLLHGHGDGMRSQAPAHQFSVYTGRGGERRLEHGD